MTDKLNQEIKIKAKQVAEDLINFMQELDTENNCQIKELEKDIEYYKSHIEELETENKHLSDEVDEWRTKFESLERKCRFNFTDLLEDVEKEAKQDKQLTEAKEIIREYSKWECEYCDYKRNPNYVTEHCSQCQKYPLHKKAEAFINKE